MLRLLLMRHAKTEANAASGKDFDRNLDARGRADAEQLGQWLAHQNHLPRRVLISPAARTRQTWDIVAAQLPEPCKAVEVESLYNAAPNDLMQALCDHGDEATPLLVIAHNPGLHEIALAMTGSGDAAARRALESNLPTSGLAILEFDTASWTGAGFRRGHLVTMVSAKLLRDGAHEG